MRLLKKIKKKMYTSYEKALQLTQKQKLTIFYQKITIFLLMLTFILVGSVDYLNLSEYLNIFYGMLENYATIVSNYAYFIIKKFQYFEFYEYFVESIFYSNMTNSSNTFLNKLTQSLQNIKIPVFQNNYKNYVKLQKYNYAGILKDLRLAFIFIIHICLLGFVFKIIDKSINTANIVFFMFGVVVYLINYKLLFELLLNLQDNEIFYRINESFKNRNLYVDSNYYLTSASLKGLEKFSDISSPWLVDYEDSGWGGDFDIQNQVDRVIERERRYIIDEISVETSPNLESVKNKPNTLKQRLVKLNQRVLNHVNTLSEWTFWFSDLSNLWKDSEASTYFDLSVNSSNIVINIFKNSTNSHLFNFKDLNYNKLIVDKQTRIDTSLKLPKIELKNDFALPKKNNISNENFSKLGNLPDRKQIVYRNNINNLDSSESIYDIKSKRPDLSKSTNYIFERQLQESRSLIMDITDYTKNVFFNKFNNFYNSKILLKNNKNINLLTFVDIKNSNYLNILNEKNTKTATLTVPKYNKNDLNLEMSLKFWTDSENFHKRIYSRSYEYPYLKNNFQTIFSFIENNDTVSEICSELLITKKLGLGAYTYQELEASPWNSNKQNTGKIYNTYFKYIINYSNNTMNFFNDNRLEIIKPQQDFSIIKKVADIKKFYIEVNSDLNKIILNKNENKVNGLLTLNKKNTLRDLSNKNLIYIFNLKKSISNAVTADLKVRNSRSFDTTEKESIINTRHYLEKNYLQKVNKYGFFEILKLHNFIKNFKAKSIFLNPKFVNQINDLNYKVENVAMGSYHYLHNFQLNKTIKKPKFLIKSALKIYNYGDVKFENKKHMLKFVYSWAGSYLFDIITKFNNVKNTDWGSLLKYSQNKTKLKIINRNFTQVLINNVDFNTRIILINFEIHWYKYLVLKSIKNYWIIKNIVKEKINSVSIRYGAFLYLNIFKNIVSFVNSVELTYKYVLKLKNKTTQNQKVLKQDEVNFVIPSVYINYCTLVEKILINLEHLTNFNSTKIITLITLLYNLYSLYCETSNRTLVVILKQLNIKIALHSVKVYVTGVKYYNTYTFDTIQFICYMKDLIILEVDFYAKMVILTYKLTGTSPNTNTILLMSNSDWSYRMLKKLHNIKNNINFICNKKYISAVFYINTASKTKEYINSYKTHSHIIQLISKILILKMYKIVTPIEMYKNNIWFVNLNLYKKIEIKSKLIKKIKLKKFYVNGIDTAAAFKFSKMYCTKFLWRWFYPFKIFEKKILIKINHGLSFKFLRKNYGFQNFNFIDKWVLNRTLIIQKNRIIRSVIVGKTKVRLKIMRYLILEKANHLKIRIKLLVYWISSEAYITLKIILASSYNIVYVNVHSKILCYNKKKYLICKYLLKKYKYLDFQIMFKKYLNTIFTVFNNYVKKYYVNVESGKYLKKNQYSIVDPEFKKILIKKNKINFAIKKKNSITSLFYEIKNLNYIKNSINKKNAPLTHLNIPYIEGSLKKMYKIVNFYEKLNVSFKKIEIKGEKIKKNVIGCIFKNYKNKRIKIFKSLQIKYIKKKYFLKNQEIISIRLKNIYAIGDFWLYGIRQRKVKYFWINLESVSTVETKTSTIGTDQIANLLNLKISSIKQKLNNSLNSPLIEKKIYKSFDLFEYYLSDNLIKKKHSNIFDIKNIRTKWLYFSNYFWWYYTSKIDINFKFNVLKFNNLGIENKYELLYLRPYKNNISISPKIFNYFNFEILEKLNVQKLELEVSDITLDEILDFNIENNSRFLDYFDYYGYSDYLENSRLLKIKNNLSGSYKNATASHIIEDIKDTEEDLEIEMDSYEYVNKKFGSDLKKFKYLESVRMFEKNIQKYNILLKKLKKSITAYKPNQVGEIRQSVYINGGGNINNIYDSSLKFTNFQKLRSFYFEIWGHFKYSYFLTNNKKNKWKFNAIETISIVNDWFLVSKLRIKVKKNYKILNQQIIINFGNNKFKYDCIRTIIIYLLNLKSTILGYLLLPSINAFSNIYLYHLLERQDIFDYVVFKIFKKNTTPIYYFDLVRLYMKVKKILNISEIWMEMIINQIKVLTIAILDIRTSELKINNFYLKIKYMYIEKVSKQILGFDGGGRCISRIFDELIKLDSTLINFTKTSQIFNKSKLQYHTVRGWWLLDTAFTYFENTTFNLNLLINQIITLWKWINLNTEVLLLITIQIKNMLENNDKSVINIIENLFYELYTKNNLSNIKYHTVAYFSYYELISYFYENILFAFNNYLEFRGQILWLNLCILFDRLFETTSEFDTLSDTNPLSQIMDTIILFFLNIFKGGDISNINYMEFLTGGEANWDNISTIPVLDDFDLNAEEVELGFGNSDGTHGITDIDSSDSLNFLGWGFENDLGTDPGNEFSTINDLFELPNNLNEFLLMDISDFYHTVFGLDSPKIGEIAPSFDITLPINSLWMVGVIYYNPTLGGAAFIDFKAMLDFIKILYLDRRISLFSKLYEIINYELFQFNENFFIFFKIKINYIFIDILQVFDSVYINPLDFIEFVYFYIIYILNYFGFWLPIFLYIIFIYFGKINIFFEKSLRKSKNNIYLYIISQTYSYTLIRFVYPGISNLFIFLKMTFSIIIILSLLYVFTEGLHIFGILRVYDSSQDNLLNINGMYFNLERDPFVEKYTPVDDMWDNFKYESTVDDEWSRIHYNREHSEILGGKSKEHSSVIDFVGFSKNFNFDYYFDDDDSGYLTVQESTKDIPDQIHNKIPDESSYIPKFIYDTELEREFFRESESYGNEIEGSLDWENRSDSYLKDIASSSELSEYYFWEHEIETSAEENPNEFSEGGLDNTWHDNMYNAVMINMSDPKWLWRESTILPIREETPTIFSENSIQLSNSLFINNESEINRDSVATYRIKTLLDRNRGKINSSPILDFWDSDPITNMIINPHTIDGSSIGTRSTAADSTNYSETDVITQYNKYSVEQNTNDTIFWNYVTTENNLPINYYNTEDLVLENFFESIYNNKTDEYSLNNEALEDDNFDVFDNELNYREVNFDNFTPKNGRNWLIENNFKIKKFVNDGIPEGYFNLSGYSLIDLENKNNTEIGIKNSQNLSLENIRRRDLKFKKLDGYEKNEIYYDEMLGEDIDKLMYFNYEYVHGVEDNYSKVFKNDEYMLKFDISQQNEWWTPIIYPEFRWEVLGDFTNYESPYLDFEIENTENTVEKYVAENNIDKSVMQDWMGMNISDLSVKKKIFNKKKKKNMLHNLIENNKNVFLIKNRQNVKDSFLKNAKLAWFKKKNKHSFESNLENWLSFDNAYKLNSGAIIKNTEKIGIKKYFGRYLQKFNNNNTLLEKNNKIEQKRISNFANLTKKIVNKKNKVFGKSLNKKTDGFTIKKINNNLINFLIKKTNDFGDSYSIKKFYINKYLDFSINLKKNLKRKTNDLISKEKTQNRYLKFEKPLKNLSKLDNIVFDSKYTNDIYHKKIQQYLQNTKNKQNYTNLKKKNNFDNILESVYLANSWGVDTKGKLVYDIVKKIKRHELIDEFSNLKKNNKLSDGLKKKIIKSGLKSRKSRKHYDIFGSRGVGEEWPLSLRMSGMVFPKYSENPIFLNDEESNFENMEILNSNFSRRMNNLSTMETDFLRNYNDVMEYVLNPWAYGRSMLEPMHDEEFDDIDIFDNVDFSLEEKDGDSFDYEFDEDFGEEIQYTDDSQLLEADGADSEDEIEFGEEWRRGDLDINTYRGYIRSEEDLLNEISRFGYWDGYKLRGGDRFLTSLNKSFIKNLHSTLNSKNIVNLINWYKPSWIEIQNIKKLKPWGLNYNKNYRWRGSQYWSIQKNIGELSEHFKSGNFRIQNNDKIPLARVQKNLIKTNNLKQNKNSNNVIKFNMFNTPYKNIDNIGYKSKKSKYGKNTDENLSKNLKFNNYVVKNDSNLSKNYKINKIADNLKSQTNYKIMNSPEHYQSTSDISWDSELKHDFRTKYFQYGKSVKSIEQHSIIQDYFDSNISLYNRAVTNKQSGDYFWYSYKNLKKNKLKKFYNNFNLYTRNSPNYDKVVKLNWDNKINQIQEIYNIENSQNSEDLINKSNDVLPSLWESWDAKNLYRKIAAKQYRSSSSDFELFDGIELGFENINIKNKIKSKNLKIRNKYSENLFGKHKKLNSDVLFNFKKNGWAKLLSTIERGNSLIKNKRLWYGKSKNNKYKTTRLTKENFVLDHLFGGYLKKKKFKNKIFDETSASFRFSAIEELFRKNKKPILLDNVGVKFSKPMVENLNLSNAIKQIYEVPYSFEFNKIEDLDDFEDEDFDEDLENEQKSLASSSIKNIKSKMLENSNIVLKISKYFDIKKNIHIKKLDNLDSSQLFENDDETMDNLLEYVEFNNYNQKLENLNKNTLISTNVKNWEQYEKNEFENISDFFYTENLALNMLNQSITNDNNLNWYSYANDHLDKNNSRFLNNYDINNLRYKSKSLQNINQNKISNAVENTPFGSNFENNESSPLFDFENAYNSSLDGDFDSEYYFNKKINTNYKDDVVFKSWGITKPIDWKRKTTVSSDISNIRENQTNSNNYSDFNGNLTLLENNNTFHNKVFYDGSVILDKKSKSYSKYNNSFIKRKNLKIKMGKQQNTAYLTKGYYIGEHSWESKTNDLENLPNNLNFFFYDKIKNTNTKTKNKSIVIKNKIGNLASLDKLKKIKLSVSISGTNLDNSYDLNEVNLRNNIWRIKNSKNINTGINNFNLNSENFSNSIIKYNKGRVGLSSIFDPFSNINYLANYKKIDPIFGNDRYREIAARGTTKRIARVKLQNLKNKNIFYYALSRPTLGLGSKQFIKENVKHYFKFKDNRGFVEKNISNYFDYSKTKNEDNDYISNIAVPINLKLGKFSNYNHYLFKDNKEIIKLKKSNIVASYNENNNVDFDRVENSSNISNILKNASIEIGPTKDKHNKSGFRVFSSSESIYPLPITRSLGVESKLFNKINSLRLYGLGKLQDYIYRPKLKQLIKNQNNFFNFDYLSWTEDYEEDGDVFLNRLEENDDMLVKNYDSQNTIYEELDKVNNINNVDEISDSLKKYKKNKINLNFNEYKELNSYDMLESSTEFTKTEDFDPEYLTDFEIENDYDFDEHEVSEYPEYVFDSEAYDNLTEVVEKYKNFGIKKTILSDEFNDNWLETKETKSLSTLLDNCVVDESNEEQLLDIQSFGENFYNINDSDKFASSIYFKNNSKEKFYDKEDWLFELYQDMDILDNNYNYQKWINSKNDENNSSFENSYNFIEKLKQNNFENNLNTFDTNQNKTLSNQSIFLYGNENNINKNPLIKNNNDYYVDDSDDMFNKILFAQETLDDDDDLEFEGFFEDLDEQGEFMLNRFENLEIPSQEYGEMPWLDSSKNWGTQMFNLSNLENRSNNVNIFRSSYFYQNKPIFNNRPNYKISNKIREKSKYGTLKFESNLNENNNWNLSREYWSEILDESFLLNNDDLKNFQNSENDESLILEKLKNTDHNQIKILKDDMANYFIKNENNYISEKYLDNIDTDSSIFNQNIKDLSRVQTQSFKKYNESLGSWNLINNISIGTWKPKNNVVFKNKILLEKNANIGILDNLKIKNAISVFAKESLNFNKNNNDIAINLGTILRKTNSIFNGQFGRRKYKKLKKKYWQRLDVLEKYLENLKKYSITDKNLKNTKTKQKFKLLKKNIKPIQSKINISKYFLNNKIDLNVKNFDYDENFDTEKNDEYFSNTNIYNENSAIFNKVKNNSNYNLPIDFKIISKNEKNTKNINNFEIFDIFSNNLESQEIETISFLNNSTNFLENTNYLAHKYKNNEINAFRGEILDKNFLIDENELDDIEETDDPYSIFSRIRNNLPKLQTSKFGNAYLPLSTVATFLNKIPNIDINSYLNETTKPTNFYINLKNKNRNNLKYNKNSSILIENIRSFDRINTPSYYKKLPIIGEFEIYHKKPKRPGLDLRSNYSKIGVEPFLNFSTNRELLDRGIAYGLGTNIYRNNAASRRSFDLALRTFGPDIRTNSTLRGYGRIDHITDHNVNSEEDSGLNNNLGFPVINEQNLYVYDLPDAVPVWGGSDISDKFLGFLWDGEEEDFNQSAGIFNALTSVGNMFSTPTLTPVLDYLENSSDVVDEIWEYSDRGGDLLDSISNIFEFSIPREPAIDYNVEPKYNRPIQIWNNTIPLKYMTWDEEDVRSDLKTEFENLGSDEDFWVNIIGSDFEKYEVNDDSVSSTINADLPYDVVSKFDLTSEVNKRWNTFQSKAISGLIFEDTITAPVSRDVDEKNIGPLGYEEGDALYDNKVLNRGWFPEKLTWNWGLREQSRVGSDLSTLELLSDYSSSYSHELDNFGFDAELEGLKSLNWAGKNNYIFNAIDDIVEGIGIEENIPFNPTVAKNLWDLDEYLSRHTYDNFRDRELFTYTEDDEDEFYWNWKEPYEYHQFKDNIFNTLGLNNYISETESWKNSKYFGNVDSSYIPGVSLALRDNELYDGILSDFSNFIFEKIPNDPVGGIKIKELPLTTDGIYKSNDYYDSAIPEFSNYTLITEEDDMDRHQNYWDEINSKDEEFHFNINETYKPKDSFNFSPENPAFLRFDPEWVVNGEGWVGNNISNIEIIGKGNIPIQYLNPSDSIYSQPKGIHSFRINDDFDDNLGMDSPYFSLSDYQNNRIVRGRDNDVSNFPINSGWIGQATYLPKFGNVNYKYITGSSNIFNYLEEGGSDKVKNYINFENSFDSSNLQIIKSSNEDLEYTNNLEDNPDFIVFNNTQFNYRDLWWKSIEGGYFTNTAKKEIATGIFFDKSDSYRDFLLSYDYRIFGKSWSNPQEIEIPVKSQQFYGDSQINDWLTSQNLNQYSDNSANKIYVFTYGLMKNSKSTFDQRLDYYSITLRNFLYKIYNIGIGYYSNFQFTFFEKIAHLVYNLINFVLFKIEFFLYINKNTQLLNFNFYIKNYIFNFNLTIIKHLYNKLYWVYEIFIKIQKLHIINSREFYLENHFVKLMEDLGHYIVDFGKNFKKIVYLFNLLMCYFIISLFIILLLLFI